MIVPHKIEKIRNYKLPKSILYDPKENWAIAKLLKYKKARFPGIYTLRPRLPIWDSKKAHIRFMKLCETINLPSFLAWKEIGKSGYHFHIYGYNYNFKKKWNGYISYKKFEHPLEPHATQLYNSYFAKTYEVDFTKIGKYCLNEPKFYFKWYGKAYFKKDGKWCNEKTTAPIILKKNSKLYINLKIVLTFEGKPFLNYIPTIQKVMEQIITKLESRCFHQKKVTTSFFHVNKNLNCEMYLPNSSDDKLLLDKLKNQLIKYFKNICQYISLKAFKNNAEVPATFLYRLISARNFLFMLTIATQTPRIQNRETMLWGYKTIRGKFFTTLGKFKPKRFKGVVGYYDFGYVKVTSGVEKSGRSLSYLPCNYKKLVKY